MNKRILAVLLIIALLCSCMMIPAASAKTRTAEEVIAALKENGVRTNDIKITGSHYVAKGKKITLKANRSVNWYSGNERIVTVSRDGVVKGLKDGTTYLYVESGDWEYTRWKITVKSQAVTSVKITAPTKTLDTKDKRTVTLKAKASPSSAAQSFTWKSSDTSVATVSSSGKVTAKSAGKVKITATASDGSKKKASVTITVKDKGDPEPTPTSDTEYRALLIGERDFSGGPQYRADRNEGDVKLMSGMLERVYGPAGKKYSVTKKINASYNEIRSLIQSTFAGTKDSDVSLFFIASHGNSSGDGDLITIEGSYEKNLPFSTLASWLNEYVRGTVIVILESCGAGSAIYDPSEQNSAGGGAEEDRSGRIASAAVRAFAAVDKGIVDSNTGELRQSRFYVLAAARHHELSWGYTGYGSYNVFTGWLVEGMGYPGYYHPAPADSNKNGRVTLTELFNYISKVGDHVPFNQDGRTYYQHVQRYPVGSQYELFRMLP